MPLTQTLNATIPKGIIFNDLKPDNLLMANGRILFSDFGDARYSQEDYSLWPVDAIGWGSPMYHSRPDVIGKNITVASDMWMLAQTSGHMWSGIEVSRS